MTKLGIDSGTGQMHLTADLYIDYTLSTNTTVQVTDTNGISSTAVVEMTIVNLNRVPYFLNLPFTLNVAENIPSGTVVYDVTARDDDTTDVLTYTVAFVPIYASALLQFDSTGEYNINFEKSIEFCKIHKLPIVNLDSQIRKSCKDLVRESLM